MTVVFRMLPVKNGIDARVSRTKMPIWHRLFSHSGRLRRAYTKASEWATWLWHTKGLMGMGSAPV